jgi:hypothetical protein
VVTQKVDDAAEIDLERVAHGGEGTANG